MNIMIYLTKFLYAILRSKSNTLWSFSGAYEGVILCRRQELSEQIETVIFHKNNAPAHTTAVTRFEIILLGFDQITHPPYSPYLAPMDFVWERAANSAYHM